MSSEDLASVIDYSKSAGYTASTCGLYTKGQLVNDKKFLLSDHNLRPELTQTWTKVAPKVELRTKEDILDGKIRLFFISEYHLVRSQLKFGKISSERLKMFGWSAFGFSPYRGGADKMARRLLTKRIRLCYDVSGWDKFIPLMKDLYGFIIEHTRDWLSDGLVDEFKWMVENTVEFNIVLHDGSVFRKSYGNPSGSGTTTRDNTLMHILISATLLSEAYNRKYGTLPSMELLNEQVLYLFGDDSVYSVDDCFSELLNEEFVYEFFTRYGLKLKFLRCGENLPLEQLEFLGFNFVQEDGFYLPKYDVVRLAHSALHTNEQSDSLDAYLCKNFALTMMSYGDNLHRDTFIRAYQTLVESITAFDRQNPVISSLSALGPLDEEILHAFYTGMESFPPAVADAYNKGVESLAEVLFFPWPRMEEEEKVFLPQSIIKMDVTNTLDTGAPNPSQVARGRALLKNLIATKQLSPEGLAWLTFALDPFHDKDIKGVSGIPDSTTGKSVVCSIVQEIQIKKPASLPAGNWGVRIASYPVATRELLANCRVYGNQINNYLLAGRQIAPVMIDFASDGTDFPEFGEGGQFIEIPPQFLKGPFKVGAMAIETCNTTAELHRQGLVTCARMNQNSCESAFFQVMTNSTSFHMGSLFPIRTVPRNLSEMVLLTGNTGWKASEGAYSVVPLKLLGQHVATVRPEYPLLMTEDFQAGAVIAPVEGASPHVVLAPIPGLNIPGNPSLYQFQFHPGKVPMDSTVQMFTGLSDETTLTIRCRWMIERFPNDQEADIVVLASDSPAYDPIALQVYSQVMQTLPAAVMFKENADTTWWRKVLGTVADVVGAGLMAMPHPIAKTVGGAVLAGNKLLNADYATLKPVKTLSPSGKTKVIVAERSASKKSRKKKKKAQAGVSSRAIVPVTLRT